MCSQLLNEMNKKNFRDCFSCELKNFEGKKVKKNPQTSTSLRNAYLSPKIKLFKENKEMLVSK
jgi:hypothetical protein